MLLLAACGDRTLESPDGRVSVVFMENDMLIRYDGAGLQLVSLKGLDRNLNMKSGPKKLKESYTMSSGKRLSCSNQWNMAVLGCDGVKLELRVSNDGVAFRFEGNEPEIEYIIPDGQNRWAQTQKTDYENFYPLQTSAAKGKYSYPLLTEYHDGVFGLITESDVLHGQSGSYLESPGDAGTYRLTYTEEPREKKHNPWRIVMVGSLASIVESTLVTDVATECQVDDVSWIKPGVSAWIYWAYNHSSKDFQKVKEYIDLAVEMKWPYNLIDWEWDEMSNGGNIEDALAYAASRGVKANLWYNSGTSWIGNGAPGPQDRLRTAEAREKEMTRLEMMGATGIKVDFFLPDGPDMIDYYLDILEDAARHHLLVDFHGCTIPRGWSRAWPNLMSHEAVYGAEWYNNNRRMTRAAAAHNATLPFTRNVIGPMDYTPCTFTDSQNPHITSDCHELALPILFESGLQHMADRPEAYLGLPQPVRDLLSGLPAAWDDTRLLAGYPGQSAVIAREKDGVWYVAGINGTDAELTVSPDFSRITTQGKNVMLVTDNASEPGAGFNIETGAALPEKLTLPARGGFVMTIRK